jgi:hypothetical protein
LTHVCRAMTSQQYEELCRYFVADQLKIPIEKVISRNIETPAREPIANHFREPYRHQIDLYWETVDNVARYVNIANAKWRTRAKVKQADVLLLQQVRLRVGAHKAVMITNTDFTPGALMAAMDEGISLFIVQPDFNTKKMPESRELARAHIQKLSKRCLQPYKETMKWKGVGGAPSKPQALGAAGSRGSPGQSCVNHPVVAARVAAPLPPPAASASGAGQGGPASGMGGGPFPYQIGHGPGPGFVKK